MASSSAFASSGNDEYFPGTTPPHVGNNEEFHSEEKLHSLSQFKTLEESHDHLSLNPKEGFESPPSPTHQESNDDTDDRKPAASVPNNIYLKTESEFTPSPEITNYHESPVSATMPAPPPVPSFHYAETNTSDVAANSSSNSSSYGTSTSSNNSDFGWRRHYNCLVEFKAREHHCRVPQKHVEGSINLGVWVNKVSWKVGNVKFLCN